MLEPLMLPLSAKPIFVAVQLHFAYSIPNFIAVSSNFHFPLE